MKYIRFVSMLLIGIVMMNLVGCDFASSPGRKYDDLYQMVKCQIPTPPFGRVGIQIVEEDDYGRILFRYSDTDTKFTGETSDNPTAVYGYFICQKRTKTDVYYFDTVCYLLARIGITSRRMSSTISSSSTNGTGKPFPRISFGPTRNLRADTRRMPK